MTEEYAALQPHAVASPDDEDDETLAPQRRLVTDTASWAIDWGRLLRTARQVAGLSLSDLSARTGLSKGYLSKLESGAAGAANPSRATLAALARALPSFRPVAHTLEPGLGADELAFAGIHSARVPADGDHTPAAPAPAPLQLGWRELEVLAALIALEAAAIPVPATMAMLARAIDRDVTMVSPVLDSLVRAGVIERVPPARVGSAAAYRCADDAPERIGVARLGDLLVLAAALIAGAPPGSTSTKAPADRRPRR